MAETKSISVQEGEGRKNENPLILILDNFRNFKFPNFNKPQNTKEVSSSSPSPLSNKVVESKTAQKPDIVKVGDPRKEFPALTLEGDESQEPSGPSSNMWQVYALGGFIIAKWLWARWNERKAAKSDKEEGGGDDASPSVEN